jgi:hypothetical protein
MSNGGFQLLRGQLTFILSVIQDITLADLPLVVEFLKTYGNGKKAFSVGELWEQSFQNANTQPKITGVRISSKGAMHFLGVAKYRTATINSDDPKMKLQPTALSKRLGIPLIVDRCNEACHEDDTHHQVKNLASFDVDENCEGASLSIDINPKSIGFGKVDGKWGNSPGGVLVVRQDGKPITPQQVEALISFVSNEIVTAGRILALSNMAVDDLETWREQVIVDHLNKAHFEDCFNTFKKFKGQERVAGWAEVASLYDV